MLSYAELDRARMVNAPIRGACRSYVETAYPDMADLARFVAHVCHTVGFDIDRYTNGVSNLVLLFEAFDQQRQRVIPVST